MTIKDILVHIDDTPRSDARLAAAAQLAARHDAHLVGLHVLNMLPSEAFSAYPIGLVDLRTPMIERERAMCLQVAAVLEAKFAERLRRDGLKGEWRVAEGDPGEIVALHARYVDLVVVGQRNPDIGNIHSLGEISIVSLMTAGRPVLVIPFVGVFERFDDHVLVGWNATPESARAINDALPLLHAAKKVTVLAINPRHGIGGDGDLPAADITLHLARHGINAEAAHTVATNVSEGDVLLSYAADIGADLLVCGMYGHSRLREVVFGGVTRSLLTEMTLPVFMVH